MFDYPLLEIISYILSFFLELMKNLNLAIA